MTNLGNASIPGLPTAVTAPLQLVLTLAGVLIFVPKRPRGLLDLHFKPSSLSYRSVYDQADTYEPQTTCPSQGSGN